MIPAEPQQTRGADRARWRVLMWVGVTVFLALATLAVVATIVGIDKNYRFRANWKAGALTQLTGLTLTNPEVARDFQSLKSEEALEAKRWTSGSVLLMKNGEYLFYKFRHGGNARYAMNPHLFLARGSNNRWYYSTYHFCMNMAGVGGDAPPDSISDFAKKYSAREFDGTSDECLKRTCQ